MTRITDHPQEEKYSLRKSARRNHSLVIILLLWISGVTWLVFQWAPDSLNLHYHLDVFQLQAWLMRFHGLLGMLFLILLGMLWRPHIRTAWSRRLNRPSGSLFFASLVLLSVSGYGIYYITGDWRDWNRYVHWAVGMAIPLAMLFHLPVKRSA